MIIHKFIKLIASVLFITLTSTMIKCSAANLVPFNGTKPIVTPAVPITNPEANNSTDCEKLKGKVKFCEKTVKYITNL